MSALENVTLNDEGFLIDHTQWTEDVAVALAEKEGIALTDAHWAVINFCREKAGDSGMSPARRQIQQGVGISSRDFFKLFPRGAIKKAAKISGLGKPENCI